MPIGVLNRIITAASNPGEIVLDPFNGSGTTVISAAMLGRKYVGIDQSEQYVGFARKRLEHALLQTNPTPKARPAKVGRPRRKEATAELFPGQYAISIAAATDPRRASRVTTETDAFGRKRVPRGPRRRHAKTA
jgi:hypothetical protein